MADWRQEAFQLMLDDKPEAVFKILRNQTNKDLHELDDKIYRLHSAIEMYTLLDDFIEEKKNG